MKFMPLTFLFVLVACNGPTNNKCWDETDYYRYDGSDGLPKTGNARKYLYPIEDETACLVYGVSSIDTFYIDLEGDGKKEKITRGRFDTMSAHGYTFYEMYLNDGTILEMSDFRTSEGADCFSQAYKFQFEPFVLTKASRPWGNESFVQPTKAKIEKFQIIDDKLVKVSETSGGTICDVRELL